MTQQANARIANNKPVRERVGLVVAGGDTAQAVRDIIDAEAAGVRQIWTTQSTPAPDTLTFFAAAAAQTRTIRLGTAIVPIYPRHPLAMAQQALALNDIAPGRIRLGVGPSHRPVMEGTYGLAMGSPMAYLREYVEILRGALWNGAVDHHGHYFNVVIKMPRKPEVPILISALRQKAFHLAGEITDGAISWLCPVSYLLDTALPTLREAAALRKHPAPPLVAHVLVALHNDRQKGLAVARQMLKRYVALPFYANMFADAGFPVASDGSVSDQLVDNLVISGDENAVAARLRELLTAGLDEVLAMSVPVENAASEQQQLARLIGNL